MKNSLLENFRPYIPAFAKMRELTPVSLIFGTALGSIFGASSLYLVLKTGLTVSASIPVAVISITLFRLLSKLGFRETTILENNVVQTAGSAGESIAFGLGVTMPAIIILGFDLDFWRVTMVAVLGGLLGILMMIPLRRALIKEQHGVLKYPEGAACAEILKAGASKESREAAGESETTGNNNAAVQAGKIISVGFVIGFVYNILRQFFSFWKDTPEQQFSDTTLKGGSISLENNPALLGVGYIIGPYISSIMMAGGVLSYLVLIPMIKYLGESLYMPLAPEYSQLIREMSPIEIRRAYILYIGAGAVMMAGIISLVRSLPTIWRGLKGGLADFRGGNIGKDNGMLPRTDQDLSMRWVVVGIIGLIAAIMLFPQLGLSVFSNSIVSLVGAILIIVLGFLFVTVSSRLTGEVGSSSNPISGMTTATLLITCLVFLFLGWTLPNPYFVTALSIGGIVCIAMSNSGTTSQDLKTGFLIGSTPRNQQIAILVGALSSALVLGPLLLFLNNSQTYYYKIDPTGSPFNNLCITESYLRQKGPLKIEYASGKFKDDQESYLVWQNTNVLNGPTGKYLVNKEGRVVYFVDPGINGVISKDAEGNEIMRYHVPLATLTSYIIKGILSQELPWGLVLLGMMIAIVLELAGIPSLAFAVGLYLPISISAPIFVGGLVRYFVDIYLRRKLFHQNLTQEQIIAETDKSNGTLLASGYIAGGAIAGIFVAVFAIVPALANFQKGFREWAEVNNPFFSGDNSNLLAMIPFIVLSIILYFVGREWLLTERAGDISERQ